MTRGELWWANLPQPWGRRPVVLVARDQSYEALTWFMVAPVTTNVRNVRTQVILDPSSDGVSRRSAIVLDHVQSIRKEWLDTRIGRLRPQTMEAVDRALHFAFGMPG